MDSPTAEALFRISPANAAATVHWGETHRYLGRQYRLKIDPAEKDRVLLRSGWLVVESRFPDDREWMRTLVRRWMRERAHRILRERFTAAAPIMTALGIRPPSLRICT